ncbi:MAG: FGGY-family carbohydrate kinase [Gammaproteobacteria bacterium]|nr:FGGY-family carbohydrate kinase [Gammaproteobacteria bacterium]
MTLSLGIDIGTSACRGCVIDAEARILAETRVSLPAPERKGPAIEQDPECWWQALTETLDELTGRVPMASIEAISIDGTSATLLCCDATGIPVSPALMYNDARAISEAEQLAHITPGDSAAHGASASLAKLLWLVQSPAGKQARYALHQADWLLGRLCGRYGISDENNALKLGYDIIRRRWPDWLAQLDIPRSLFPEVVPAGQAIGRLSDEWCQRWGFSAGTRVISGTTDSTASFMAAGAGAGEAVTSLGSTLVLKVLSEQPVFSPVNGIYSHRLGNHWLTGGASNSGGAVLQSYFSVDEIRRLTTLLQPDRPTGLDYYPLVCAGERFPVNNPQQAPRMEPRPAEDAVFFQGMLEGIAEIEKTGYRRLAELGAPWPKKIITTGGGAANSAWRTIRSRRLGIPVVAAEHMEAAYGAALLARRSAIYL